MTTGTITFILGGTRSGKSDFAIKYSLEISGKKGYLATAEPLDTEMQDRIALHKIARPDVFDTIEEPVNLADVIQQYRDRYSLILLDCLTLWLSNIIDKCSDEQIEYEASRVIKESLCSGLKLVVVSNELGMGIVPNTKVGRRFRDIAGVVNKIFAKAASEVYLVTAGIPIKIK